MQLATINNQPTMSSREMAELCEKRHDSVKRTIEILSEKGLISFSRRVETSHVGAGARPVEVYSVNKRDSYVVVAQLSPEFTARLVDRWQELENKNVPMTLEDLLRHNVLAIQQLSQKVIQLETKIEEDKPLTDFGLAISASATEVLIGEWIKAINDGSLKMGRNKVFAWFRDEGYLSKSNLPYQQFIVQGLFKVKESLVNTASGQKATFTTLLTGKGQVYFANKLKKD